MSNMGPKPYFDSGAFWEYSAEARAKISAAKKGKPSNNPTGKRKGAPMIDRKRMRLAVRRVLKRTCMHCVFYQEHVANEARVQRTVGDQKGLTKE